MDQPKEEYVGDCNILCGCLSGNQYKNIIILYTYYLPGFSGYVLDR